MNPKKGGAEHMNIAGYLAEVIDKHRTGQATEHSYRPALERLFQSIDPALSNINEPKRSDAGMPDFIFQREEPDGSLKYVIVEVKADNQIEDAVVQAKKDFAQQIAVASGMEYRIIKSTDADKRHYRVLM